MQTPRLQGDNLTDHFYCGNNAVLRRFTVYTLRKIPKSHQIYCCGNYAFPQNFQTKKLGEISVFYTVHVTRNWFYKRFIFMCINA